MKRLAKLLVAVMALALVFTTFAFTASAEDTVVTYDGVYKGQYTTANHSGTAYIVFGQVDVDATEYGIVVEDSEGARFAFAGREKGEDGKFGIALYDLPEGVYNACVYAGSPEDQNYGEWVEINSVIRNEIHISYVDNGDSTLTVTVEITGTEVNFASVEANFTYDSSVLTYVESAASAEAGSPASTHIEDEELITYSVMNATNKTAPAKMLTATFSYSGAINTSVDFIVYDIFDASFNTEEYTVTGGSIVIG